MQITFDASQVTRAIEPLGQSAAWIPRVIGVVFPELGKRIVSIMRSELESHRYTGRLGDSVQSEYNSAKREVSIGPTAKRGQYDAGLIAQLGTIPVNVPWKPIAAWGAFRGLNNKQIAGVRKVLSLRGVAKHPFLDETMNRPEFNAELADAANKLGVQIAARVFVNK